MEGQEPRYLINVKQYAKFVVDLADTVAPTDIEEGMRVGVDRNKYQIHLPLPAKIDPSVTMMQVRILRFFLLFTLLFSMQRDKEVNINNLMVMSCFKSFTVGF